MSSKNGRLVLDIREVGRYSTVVLRYCEFTMGTFPPGEKVGKRESGGGKKIHEDVQQESQIFGKCY